MSSLADKYFVKAVDEYPFNLEDALENLEYALSYNPDHVGANRLMGDLKRDYFHQYQEAEDHYCAALAADPSSVATCYSYLKLLLKLNKVKEVTRLVNYLEKLPGSDPARIHMTRAHLAEMRRAFGEARLHIHEAMLATYCSKYGTFLEGELERIEKKIQLTSTSGAIIV